VSPSSRRDELLVAQQEKKCPSSRRDVVCPSHFHYIRFINSYLVANTYTQLHHQFVFATQYRNAAIHSSWKEQLHKYITAIVQDHNHKMLQINTMPDHLHMLVGLRPVQSVSSLMQIVKSESTKWIRGKKFCSHLFAWQEGYGAFSYSKSELPNVILYIQQQEIHHRKKTFCDEYIHMLIESGIEFDERYIFKEPI